MSKKEFDPPLDKGIEAAVLALRHQGVETFESCEGGNGHAFLEPTVRFEGEYPEGLRAVAIAIEEGLDVAELRRVYDIQNGELKGPWWELTFVPTTD